jgi:uncharacterized ubiquitin-like protein YukD
MKAELRSYNEKVFDLRFTDKITIDQTIDLEMMLSEHRGRLVRVSMISQEIG